MKTFKSRLLATTITAGMAMVALPAAAQITPDAIQTTQADGSDATQGDVIVTGSRIARPDIDAPTPVAVVDSTQLALDAQQNISDTLNELPQVGLGNTRTNSNFLTSGTGVSTVNLRALGASRTLVLVNGRRFVAGFGGDTAVDLNNIPTDFVERIEVTTGGSSAVYGTDAVAGVVNFILKDKFEGIRVRAQASITGEGDNPRQFASITAGTTFGSEDRGNLLLNFSYDNDDGLFSRKRARSAQDCAGLVCGPAAYSSYAAQGRFQLVGASPNVLPGNTSLFTFDPNNSLVYGFPASAGYNRNNDRYIAVPLTRYLASGIANYDLTDNIELFAEVTYGRVRSVSSLEPFALDSANDLGNTIGLDNPFIPGAVAAQIATANAGGAGITGISFRRRQNGVYDRSNRVQRDTWRVATGARGDVGSNFRYELSYVYGHLRDLTSSEDIDTTRYNQALDAVRIGAGNVLGTDIVCRDVAARAAGCIPINLFGFNTSDPRANSYVQAVVPKSEEIQNTQHVVSASISGSPFSTWAGDVGIAFGVEYRKEKVVDDLDILTNTGGNSGNQIPDLVGSQDVKEVFGELNVPLLRDGFVSYVGVFGAARYSDYSTVGGVFSWNAGAEFEPFRGLRFRGQYAEANRAPNNSELFSQPSETFAAVTDPCNGVTATNDPGGYGAACRAIPGVASAIAANGTFAYTLADLQGINGFVGGNLNLNEETAKTYTLGAVITPQQVSGLSFTVDYYKIKIDGAVSTLGRNYSIQQCLETGSPVFCDNVVRSAATGFVTQVNAQLINVAQLQSEGIDVGLRYSRPLGVADDDRLTLTGNYTHLFKYLSQPDPSSPADDFAGTFGPAFSRDRFSVRATYGIKDVSFSWQTQFLSGGPYVLDFVDANPAVEALNNVDDYWLHDAQVRFDLTSGASFFVGVDNVFDKKPPYLPGANFGTPTGLETGAEFDVFGRRFTAGATFRF